MVRTSKSYVPIMGDTIGLNCDQLSARSKRSTTPIITEHGVVAHQKKPNQGPTSRTTVGIDGGVRAL